MFSDLVWVGFGLYQLFIKEEEEKKKIKFIKKKKKKKLSHNNLKIIMFCVPMDVGFGQIWALPVYTRRFR